MTIIAPAPTTPSTSSFAVASIVLAFILPPLGLIFAILGRNEIKRGERSGERIAVVGLISSIVTTALAVAAALTPLIVGAVVFVFVILVGGAV